MTTHHETYTAAPFGPAMMLKALWPAAGWNVLLSVALCLAAVWLGFRAGELFGR